MWVNVITNFAFHWIFNSIGLSFAISRIIVIENQCPSVHISCEMIDKKGRQFCETFREYSCTSRMQEAARCAEHTRVQGAWWYRHSIYRPRHIPRKVEQLFL